MIETLSGRPGFAVRRAVQGVLREGPRWLFLAALVFAPWADGGTTATSIRVIDFILAIILGFWGIQVLVSRRIPVVPLVPVITGALLLALGWLMAVNGGAIYDQHFEIFVPVAKRFGSLPSSVDRVLSISWMIRATVLIGCVCFVADRSTRSSWLLRVWATVGIGGGSIALLGLLQKATGAVIPFWMDRQWIPSTFFATFYYHANAGAFLNLVFPPLAGLALRSMQKRGGVGQEAIWFIATLFVIVSMAANTSRMAQVIGLALIAVVFASAARRPLYRAVVANPVTSVCAVALTISIVLVIAQASRIDRPIDRWRTETQNLGRDARWAAYPVAFAALPDAGWCGFGPGTFRAVFPHYQEVVKGAPEGTWAFLHQDYLQTLIEWGWVASAGWGVLFFGGIWAGARSLRRLRSARIQDRRPMFLTLALISLAGVAVHALVDFPLQIYSIQLYVATFLGICWGSTRWDLSRSVRGGSRKFNPPAIGLSDAEDRAM